MTETHEIDLIQETLNEIAGMKQRVNEEARQKKQNEEQTIYNRLRTQFSGQPIFVLILDPKPEGEDHVRLASTSFQHALKYLQTEEVPRFVEKKDQARQRKQIAGAEPKLGKPLRFRLGSTPDYFEIRCVDLEYVLQCIQTQKQWLEEKVKPARCSCAYDD